MNKNKQHNLILAILIAVAVVYGLILAFAKETLYWDYPLDAFLATVSNFLYGLAVFAIASLVYLNLLKKLKSVIVAKGLSVIIAVLSIIVIQVLVFLIKGITDIDFVAYTQYQLWPAFDTYRYLFSVAGINIVAKMAWMIYYITLFLKYYVAALFFVLLVKAQTPAVDQINAVNSQDFANPNSENRTSDSNESLPAFCPHCGSPVTSTGSFCAHCGKPLLPNQSGFTSTPFNPNPQPDVPSTGFNVLAFFVPMVGLILYAIWSNQFPKKSKAIGKWALIGFICGIIFAIIMYAIMLSMMMNQFNIKPY